MLTLFRLLPYLAMGLFPAASGAAAEVTKPALLVLLKETAANRMERDAAQGSSAPAASALPTLDTLNRQFGVSEMRRVLRPGGRFEQRHREAGLHRWYRIAMPPGSDLQEALERYQEDPNVELAELEDSYSLAWTPNDPKFSDQWHYGRVDLERAWNVATGSGAVTVQVIDSGIDLDHPDLEAILWTNTGEIPNDHLDNDNNGYVDDIHGWDYFEENGLPTDAIGHGTHCSGTIGAISNNALGVAGVAGGAGSGGARIMTSKAVPDGGATAICESFLYGADNGAAISSNSWGCDGPCSSTFTMVNQCIDYFRAFARPGGGLVVFAAGNEGNSQPFPGDPSAYGPAITVASTNRSFNRSATSNYGGWVDISAPGEDVFSTLPNGYGFESGTSMAAPHVAGLAALLLSRDPSLTAAEVERLILNTTDAFGWAGQINAGHALEGLQHLKANNIENWTTRRYPGGSGSVHSTTGIAQVTFLTGYLSAPLASGVYFVKRSELRYQVTASDFVGPVYLFPIDGASSKGWSAANPNLQTGFCHLLSSSTGSSFTLQNFVYESTNVLGQSLGFFPNKPANANCAYGVIGELRCTPPSSGNWVLTESCTIDSAIGVPAGVIVEPGAVLTIAASGSLDIDLVDHALVVKNGGGVLIKNGGKIF